MSSLKTMVRHPSRLFHDPSDDVADRLRALAKRPVPTAGLIVMVLALVGLAYMWPELQRYLRMKRM